MFFDKLTGYRIECMFKIAAANDARIVFALWVGMVRDPRRDAGIEASTRSRRRILRQSIEGFRFRKNILNLGFCGIELLRPELAQSVKSGGRGKVLRLAYAFKRPADVLLKIGQKRGIGGVEALAQDIARGFKRGGFRAFEKFGELVERLFDPLVIGRLGHGLRRFQARMRKQNCFKVIFRGAVVAVRPVAVVCLGLYELFIDLGLRAPHMLGQIDESGKARELQNGAAQFGFRSDFDQRKKPRHDGANAHRNRIDAED